MIIQRVFICACVQNTNIISQIKCVYMFEYVRIKKRR